jgi:hypothetical protein
MANGSMLQIIAPDGKVCQIGVIHLPCGMAAYLVHHGLVDKFSLVAEQGHLIGRPGFVYIDLEKEGDEITTVKVGGSAVTVMNGEISLLALAQSMSSRSPEGVK